MIALGERIVEELGLTDSTDTLGRWMAHRLAELLDRAENERSAKAREAAAVAASDLVLRIWRHRSAWPRGWPPKSSVAALRALDPPPYERPQPSGSPWLDALPNLDRIQSRERTAWLHLGLADLPFDDEERWLDDGDVEMTQRERAVLERLRKERLAGIAQMLTRLEMDELPKTAAGRREAAAALLEQIDIEREQLHAQVLAQVRPARRSSKRRSKTSRRRSGEKK